MSFTVSYGPDTFEVSVAKKIQQAGEVSDIIERLIKNNELLGLWNDPSDEAIYGKLETGLRWQVPAENKAICKKRLKDVLSEEEFGFFKQFSTDIGGQIMQCYGDNRERKIDNFIYAVESYYFSFFDVCILDGFTMAFPMTEVYFSNFDLFSAEERTKLMTEISDMEKSTYTTYLVDHSKIQDKILSDFICNYKIL